MLRTIFFLGLAIIVGSVVLSVVLGFAMVALVLAVKVLALGAIAYLALRIISPRTADAVRDSVERRTLGGY